MVGREYLINVNNALFPTEKNKMADNTVSEEVKKKRRRQPKNKMYFGEEQEKAVVDYLNSNDAYVKNEIFEDTLKPAFTKMIESIIRRYNLYVPCEEFQETFDDTISFLMMKLSCYDPTTNYKAYSYCGTVCKNYLIYKLNQYSKQRKRNVSYDDPNETSQESYGNNPKYSLDDNSTASFITDLTGVTLHKIENMVSDKHKDELKPNELKVGNALVELLHNWEDLFVHVGSDKFNKSSILLFIKENTLLSTQEIRNAMKIFKTNYFITKERLIERER